MKILFVYDTLSEIGGGSQIASLTWLTNLKKEVLNIKLLCNQNYLKYLKNFKKNNLITEKSLNLNFIYPNFSLPLFLSPTTKKIILQYNPELIHLHEPSILSWHLMHFAKKNNIKILTSFHTNYQNAKISQFPLNLLFKKNSFFNKLIWNFHKSILQQSNYLTAPSKSYQKKLIKEFKKQCFVLPYPIRNIFFKKRKIKLNKVFKLITVSRLSGEKNIDLLIDIMSLLKNKFTLTIVGDGIDRKFLEKKSKKLGLEKNIIFLGWINQKKLPEIYKNHHLFISTSAYETFGITYIEALASGLPCLIYKYPVSQEIIPNNMAIFFNTFNPKIWADKLIEIQNNFIIYKKLTENIKKNYQIIYQYHEKQSTKKLIEIYKNIVNN